MQKDSQPDYDSPWKEVLERYFTAFMAFFFPAIHTGIDWARGYEFLDKHQGRSRQDILELFRFLDWVLVLPDAEEDRLWIELQQFEEQYVMRYVTSVERIGIKKGLQQGEVRLLRRQLTRRFGELPAWAETRLREAPSEQLETWGERLLDADRLEAVFQSDTEHCLFYHKSGSSR